MKSNRWVVFVAVLAVATSVWADPGEESRNTNASVESTPSNYSNSSSGMGWQGWGLRAGLSSDVDQFVGGAHFNLGELASHLRFQPDVQLGAGDDVTTLYGTAPVYYRFESGRRMTPYAGGGLALGWVDADNGATNQSDSSFELGAKATGGLEWPRKEDQSFFLELSLGIGDVHDATILAAWTF
jgi:opacity protein-like surface antigen